MSPRPPRTRGCAPERRGRAAPSTPLQVVLVRWSISGRARKKPSPARRSSSVSASMRSVSARSGSALRNGQLRVRTSWARWRSSGGVRRECLVEFRGTLDRLLELVVGGVERQDHLILCTPPDDRHLVEGGFQDIRSGKPVLHQGGVHFPDALLVRSTSARISRPRFLQRDSVISLPKVSLKLSAASRRCSNSIPVLGGTTRCETGCCSGTCASVERVAASIT